MVIQRLANCLVRINPKDHAPLHFQIVMNDGREAWVRIDTVEIIHGKVTGREVAAVLDWAAAQREFLAAKFKELRP
jgi:hypothetical protein